MSASKQTGIVLLHFFYHAMWQTTAHGKPSWLGCIRHQGFLCSKAHCTTTWWRMVSVEQEAQARGGLLGERDHQRAGTSARLGSGSANLSGSSFKSTFLNVLPWGQRNSQNKHEFFRRMECVYCCSLRHRGDKKGLFSYFKEDILSINFYKHTQTKPHKNTSYINLYMWLPPPPLFQQ